MHDRMNNSDTDDSSDSEDEASSDEDEGSSDESDESDSETGMETKTTDETEKAVKNATKATIRCLPLEGEGPEAEPGECVKTGAASARRVLFAKNY